MQSCHRTCNQYFSDTLVLFLAGLIIALAIEYSNLNKRIALGTILCIGSSPRRCAESLNGNFTLNLSFIFRLHFGLTCCTIFLSLWIANSAVAAMMCPIIKAVVTEMHSVSMLSMAIGESSISTSTCTSTSNLRSILQNKVFNAYMSQEEEPVEPGE